jgi:hypothetical protein
MTAAEAKTKSELRHLLKSIEFGGLKIGAGLGHIAQLLEQFDLGIFKESLALGVENKKLLLTMRITICRWMWFGFASHAISKGTKN